MRAAELLSGLRSIEWDLQDLEDTVSIVEGNRQKFQLEEEDVQVSGIARLENARARPPGACADFSRVTASAPARYLLIILVLVAGTQGFYHEHATTDRSAERRGPRRGNVSRI